MTDAIIRGKFAEHTSLTNEFKDWLVSCVERVNSALAHTTTKLSYGIKRHPGQELPSTQLRNLFRVECNLATSNGLHMWQIRIRDTRLHEAHIVPPKDQIVLEFSKTNVGCLTGTGQRVQTSDVSAKMRILLAIQEGIARQHAYDLLVEHYTPDFENKALDFANTILKQAGIDMDNPETFQAPRLPDSIPPPIRIS